MRPGVYTLDLFAPGTPTGPNDPATESRAYSFNVDASAESDLKRASRDKLERNKPNRDPRTTGLISLRSAGTKFGIG